MKSKVSWGETTIKSQPSTLQSLLEDHLPTVSGVRKSQNYYRYKSSSRPPTPSDHSRTNMSLIVHVSLARRPIDRHSDCQPLAAWRVSQNQSLGPVQRGRRGCQRRRGELMMLQWRERGREGGITNAVPKLHSEGWVDSLACWPDELFRWLNSW